MGSLKARQRLLYSRFCSVREELGVGIVAGLHVYQGFKGSPYITEKRKAQQLIGGLRSELRHPILLRRIAKT